MADDDQTPKLLLELRVGPVPWSLDAERLFPFIFRAIREATEEGLEAYRALTGDDAEITSLLSFHSGTDLSVGERWEIRPRHYQSDACLHNRHGICTSRCSECGDPCTCWCH